MPRRTAAPLNLGGAAADDPAPSAETTGKRKRDDDDAEPLSTADADSDAPPASDSAPVLAGVASVDFSCGKGGKGHQTNSAVSGKRKKGAKLLMDNSGVARLTDPAGRHWTARACVRGKLLELNERLIREPSLASEDPTGAGYRTPSWCSATSEMSRNRRQDGGGPGRAKRYEANEIRNDAM